jgi:hypothetical protein
MKTMFREVISDPALLQQWVDTWRRAGEELERIRREEIQSVDTREAIRQIFGTGDLAVPCASLPTSGLIEQQAWFALIHAKNR